MLKQLQRADHQVAVKCLRQKHRKAEALFYREVNILKRLEEKKHPHLIPLILSYELEDLAGKFKLVFPLAKGDMRVLWGEDPEDNRHSALWILEQCYGISDALSVVHQDHKTNIREWENNPNMPHFGRHGDIKPDNILIFEKQGGTGSNGPHMVLSDFGLGNFHRLVSRSRVDPRKTPNSPTYRAPEFDVKRDRGWSITRRADIWNLACTFLELLTWYIMGKDAVQNTFANRREYEPMHITRDQLVRGERYGVPSEGVVGLFEDIFFQIIEDAQAEDDPARVKPSVTDWIEELSNHSRCSKELKEFLYYIRAHMMEIDPNKRAQAHGVARFLRSLLDNYQGDAKTKSFTICRTS